ncbi:mechanosensitive ion channel domain-containing protein [Microbacterium sp. NPDC096154]|uniref:mechanosensitive ion channel family protein n=1 Tax=Microbacterium sp. NPDC096154 TaxID=3155549 RepID=UPI003326FDB5
MLEPWPAFIVALLVCVLGAVLLTAVLALSMRLIARRRTWPRELITHARTPFRMMLIVLATWIAVVARFPEREWMPGISQGLSIAAIVVAAWLLGGLVMFVTAQALGRYRIDIPDNRVARRIRTQTLILRRLAIAGIVVIALGAVLLTFPAVRAVGASLLASAGILSVVAGLAAQSVLANMFAGLQLVFSDALRVDDVIVVEGEWGKVGEITLSYVVLDLWDDRRLVLPCTYFTTNPFQNWTRQGSELLGSVELDVDWRVSTTRMRAHLDTVLAQTPLWDGRASVLQVTEATGGLIRVRILVTARDAPTLFDLRCVVREAMVLWVQEHNPRALPVQRVMMTDDVEDPVRAAGSEQVAPTDAGLFSGSEKAEERAAHFTQSMPVIPPRER